MCGDAFMHLTPASNSKPALIFKRGFQCTILLAMQITNCSFLISGLFAINIMHKNKLFVLQLQSSNSLTKLTKVCYWHCTF